MGQKIENGGEHDADKPEKSSGDAEWMPARRAEAQRWWVQPFHARISNVMEARVNPENAGASAAAVRPRVRANRMPVRLNFIGFCGAKKQPAPAGKKARAAEGRYCAQPMRVRYREQI
jgi:hypothetical protein